MRLFRRVRYLLQRGRREQELADELAFHRSQLQQEHRDLGLSEELAQRAASRKWGNTTLALEDAHHVWFPAAIEGLFQDLHYAWRGLTRSKVLLAVACLSLGLSTGFGTALFSVVNAIILQPVTAKRPAALVHFSVGDGNRISLPNLRDLCAEASDFACSGYRIDELLWRQSNEPVRVFGQVVSPHYFSMLGIDAMRGRVFTSETVRETPDTVVLTHAFWERQLGADANVIGRTLVLTGHPYTVIGVLPRGFRSIWGLGIAPSVYLPAGSGARADTTSRTDAEYELLGVLAPGQTLAEFRARLATRAKALETSYPVENRGFGQVRVLPFNRFGLFLSSDDPTMRVILLFASLVIVIVILLAIVACVNVAGLLVARGIARQREIAIRLSIGCGRLRLARLLLAESFLLALAGVGLGAALSVWLARLLVAVPLPFPAPFEVEVPVDTHLLAYLAGLVSLATCVVGLAPLLQALRVSIVGAGGSAPRTLGGKRWSMRAVLITVQVTMSTLLLVATTLFVRSLWNSSQIDPGFDVDRVVTIEPDTRSRQLTPAGADAYNRTAMDRLRARPDVTAVSGAIVVPLSMASIVSSVAVNAGDQDQFVTINGNWILPDYFRVMGIPIRSGRDFNASDRQPKPHAAIVNETFARHVFPGRNALGQRIRRPPTPDSPEPWAEIVAVVADSRYLTLGEEIRPQVYWPFGPDTSKMTIHVRTERDAGALAGALPDVLSSVDPRVLTRARPLRSVMAIALFPAQAAALVLAALGLVGWALTVTGLYGLVSYAMTRRVPELGLRVALGATPWSLIRLLLRDGLAITMTGMAAGLAIAWLATPFLSIFLAGVPPRDPTSFGLVAAALVGTALFASYGPARRAKSLSPTDALRSE